jgi:sulfite reductase (NADPH) flavoprotein alpha-component
MGRPIRILFGTETGNAEGCADELREAVARLGLPVVVSDMDDYDREELPGEAFVFIVTSTFGNGDPPYNAHAMMEHVKGASAPSLAGVRYSVCALGDRSYPNFAQCGKDFDTRFAALGAERIVSRTDCDVDYEVPFDTWKGQVVAWLKANHPDAGAAAEPAKAKPAGGGLWGKVSSWFGGKKPEEAEPAPPVVSAPVAPATRPAPGPKGWDKEHPFPARLVEARRLNGTGSDKETFHYTLDLTGSGIAFQSGDSFSVFAPNPPAEVEGILVALGLDPESPVRDRDGRTLALRGVLARRRDLQAVSVDLLRRVAASGGPGAAALAAGGASLADYLRDRYVWDVLRDHPNVRIPAQDLIDLLKAPAPRLYSVGSSPKVSADRVDFLIETLRYERLGRPCEGVASVWFADRLHVGDEVPLWLVPNAEFRLPGGTDDIIMVGPGTGLAPFRAFLQERESTGATGKNWLFFGHQHQATDFLYRDEIEAWRASGCLARLDLAWSRDQDHKVYVQDRMREAGAEIWRWLEGGAHVYVCGDAKGMAPGVHAALIQIAATHGGLAPEAAESWLQGLVLTKRYHRDVY